MTTDGLLLLVATGLVLASCGLPPESVERISKCSDLYFACVENAPTLADYQLCRAKVDEVCLDDDAGTP